MAKRVLLKVCDKCKVYSVNGDDEVCPICNEELTYKSIDVKKKSEYSPIANEDSSDINTNMSDFDFEPLEDSSDNSKNVDDVVLAAPKQKETVNSFSSNFEEQFTGIVYNYKNSDSDSSKYSRLFLVRLWDAIVYKQRMEDVLHYFRLHVGSGKDSDGMELSRNINVNVHGTIVGGSHISDNCRVTVRGKFKNGVLMASDITDDESGSHIKFRRSYKAIASAIIVAFLFIFGLIYAIANGSSFGGAGRSIGTLFKTLVITYIVVLVLYLVVSITKFGIILRVISQRKMNVPWIALFIISFAIALFIFSNLAGVATSLGSLKGTFTQVLSTIILYGIIFFGIFLAIKSLIK